MNFKHRSGYIDVVILDVLWAKCCSGNCPNTEKDFPRLPILVISTGYDDKFATSILQIRGLRVYHRVWHRSISSRSHKCRALRPEVYQPLSHKTVLADTFQKDGSA